MNESSASEERAHQFMLLFPLLIAMRNEYTELTKKKPDTTLSKLKVKTVNRLLNDILELVVQDDDAKKYLDLLDDDDLPQFSDVVIILSQYVSIMTRIRKNSTYKDAEGDEHWILDDEKDVD